MPSFHHLGRTLQEEIRTQRQMNTWQVLQILRELLEVLVYLKRMHVIHEDIKADNILLLAECDGIRLIDFGLARRVTPPDYAVPPQEPPCGAQTHYSPEKAASEGHDFRSDLWAIVCVVVHCLSGVVPWMSRYGHLPYLHLKVRILLSIFGNVLRLISSNPITCRTLGI